MMKLTVKICGMRESDNIMAAAELEPEIMGFIFYPKSPRFAGELLKPDILSLLPQNITKAGVFVNADYRTISETIKKYSLEIVQLHGDESPDLCFRLKETGIRVIKAFSLNENSGFISMSQYIQCTDYFLFDSFTSDRGGSGQKFDWKKVDDYDLGHPFFLSGGISPDDATVISGINSPSFYGVDLNSRFEIEPGLKNIEKLKVFLKELRH
jgi:phosphoribosylanthranilate isomerase